MYTQQLYTTVIFYSVSDNPCNILYIKIKKSMNVIKLLYSVYNTVHAHKTPFTIIIDAVNSLSPCLVH